MASLGGKGFKKCEDARISERERERELSVPWSKRQIYLFIYIYICIYPYLVGFHGFPISPGFPMGMM